MSGTGARDGPDVLGSWAIQSALEWFNGWCVEFQEGGLFNKRRISTRATSAEIPPMLRGKRSVSTSR